MVYSNATNGCVYCCRYSWRNWRWPYMNRLSQISKITKLTEREHRPATNPHFCCTTVIIVLTRLVLSSLNRYQHNSILGSLYGTDSCHNLVEATSRNRWKNSTRVFLHINERSNLFEHYPQYWVSQKLKYNSIGVQGCTGASKVCRIISFSTHS